MAQMVLISEWLAYHVWITRPVCPNVRFVTVFLLLKATREEALKIKLEQRQQSKGGAEVKCLSHQNCSPKCNIKSHMRFYDKKWPLADRKTKVS